MIYISTEHCSANMVRNGARRYLNFCPYHQKPQCLIITALSNIRMNKQSLSAPSDQYFRSLVGVLNSHSSTKVKDVGKDMIRQKISYKAVECRKTIKNIIVSKNVAVGSGSWTSDANDTYTGATVHLIDKNWELKSFPLGVVKKGHALMLKL